MNTTTKLAAAAGALVLVVGTGFGLGTVVGPVDVSPAAAATPGESHDGEHTHGAGGLPGGLASSIDGYSMAPTSTTLSTGAAAPFSFVVAGPDGNAVTAFDVVHEQRMHLIVVRRDGSGFQHLHPQMSPDGVWSIPLSVRDGGSYRAFADFTPTGGAPTVLGVDLAAPGMFTPIAAYPSRLAQVGRYTVEFDGDLVAGRASPLSFRIRQGADPVTDLQPYLGALGHLVVLREGDLAYLHTHPEPVAAGAPGPGTFVVEVPTDGVYRAYLQFRHEGKVFTAEFALPTVVGGAGLPAGDGGAGTGGHDHGGGASHDHGGGADGHDHGGG